SAGSGPPTTRLWQPNTVKPATAGFVAAGHSGAGLTARAPTTFSYDYATTEPLLVGVVSVILVVINQVVVVCGEVVV
ncbi:MAG TPA: hypothetical protein VFS83_12910, partial [Ktedonobacterales bacterium]|nr:hypothetical protein [Ktedonobacterales bacterium]